jgi:hypothetical protein
MTARDVSTTRSERATKPRGPAFVDGEYCDDGVFERDEENNPFKTMKVFVGRGKCFRRRMRVWQNVPSYMAPRGAQAHVFGGDENGKIFRTLTPTGKWRYCKGRIDGEKNRLYVSFRRKMSKKGNNEFPFARVVLAAVHRYSASDLIDMEACHIVRLDGVEDRSDDKISNLYLGTRADNAADDVEKKGRPNEGCRIPFVGRKAGTDEFEPFDTQDRAAEKAGVRQCTVSKALKNGCIVGKERWEFWYVPVELDANANERLALVPGSETKEGIRFVTNRNRRGTRVPIDRDGLTCIDVEQSFKPHDSGYDRIMIHGKPKTFSWIVAEVFNGDDLEAAVKRTGLPKDELQVDHVNGDESDNRPENLRFVSRLEHANKNSRAVAEVVADGEYVSGRAWVSAGQAGEATGANGSNILEVCRKKYSRSAGMYFKFVDELGNDREIAEATRDAAANFEVAAKAYAERRAKERVKEAIAKAEKRTLVAAVRKRRGQSLSHSSAASV